MRGEAPSQRARALREEIFGSALTLDEVAYIRYCFNCGEHLASD